MAKPGEGQKLVCVPCAREVVISNCGISRTTLWCCGKPMKPKAVVSKKAKTCKKK